MTEKKNLKESPDRRSTMGRRIGTWAGAWTFGYGKTDRKTYDTDSGSSDHCGCRCTESVIRRIRNIKRSAYGSIVTPHLGEMSRLVDMPTEYIKKNILMTAQDFSREYNVIRVLKDTRTITSIPYGKTYVNTSGNHGMATAGSGDVLTGIIAGLLAGGLTPEDAAVLGVCVHGLSGDAMVEKNRLLQPDGRRYIRWNQRGIKMKTEQDYQRVYAGINLDAVMHNLEKMRTLIKR